MDSKDSGMTLIRPFTHLLNIYRQLQTNHSVLANVLLPTVPLGVMVVLFNCKLLPKSIAKPFGRVYHYLSLPPLILAQALGLRGNLFDQVDSNVFIGGIPLGYHVKDLQAAGITAVVNLCDEYEGPVTQYKQNSIVQLHVPTIDHLEPSLEDLKTAVAFIDQQAKKGGKVLVHCRAGRGRSAAVVYCWLLYKHGYDLKSAQSFLVQKRRKVRKGLFKQVNVLKYYDYLQKSNPHKK